MSEGGGLYYEYKYTVDGWLTAAALAQGEMEHAEGESHEVMMKASLSANRLAVNFFLVTVVDKDKNKRLHQLSVKGIGAARRKFSMLCLKYKANHKRYNPQ
jgi:hypothetical protein